jgi:alpha-methylacyl-CoA racemase
MGPLDGVRVVELAGTAPCAFAGAFLADLGADVVRIDRPTDPAGQEQEQAPPNDPMSRGKRSVTANLKDPAGLQIAHGLISRTDILIEGFRPGVCERLGIGPETFLESNPALIFGRITGWGQNGAWSHRPGHDLTYLAVTGALDADRQPGERPDPPSAYLSSFAGGGMIGLFGILAALYERTRSGRGQVVDAAMVDGAAMLDVLIRQWRNVPGNDTVLDAPFYTTYVCRDGRHVAVGAIESGSYTVLLEQLGLSGEPLPNRKDSAAWPELRARIGAAFIAHDAAFWAKVFEEHEACVVPVLTPDEAAELPALRDRATYVEVAGRVQPGPAPKLSRTPGSVRRGAPRPGEHTVEVLDEWLR